MEKGRLEAFSDGVIAIIITIMVLDMKVPAGADLAALEASAPVFLGYALSYANIPDTGLLLDGTPWAGLPFAEGQTLHFKPLAKEAARG